MFLGVSSGAAVYFAAFEGIFMCLTTRRYLDLPHNEMGLNFIGADSWVSCLLSNFKVLYCVSLSLPKTCIMGHTPLKLTVAPAAYFPNSEVHDCVPNTHRYPNLPCAKVGAKGTSMPLELLEIVSGQRFTQHLSNDQRLKMMSLTSAPPKERFRTLQLCADTVHASVENGALVVCCLCKFQVQCLAFGMCYSLALRPTPR